MTEISLSICAGDAVRRLDLLKQVDLSFLSENPEARAGESVTDSRHQRLKQNRLLLTAPDDPSRVNQTEDTPAFTWTSSHRQTADTYGTNIQLSSWSQIKIITE